MLKHRWYITLGIAVSLVALTPSPAFATNYNYCGAGAPDVQDGAWGNWAPSGPPLHGGPRGSCAALTNASGRLDYHCYVLNPDSLNTWTYLRLADYGYYGWVWDAYLTNGGSIVPCP